MIYLDWREHSRQLDPKWRASLYRLLLFLSRYGELDLDWSIGVDLTSDPRYASPNRSLTYLMLYREHWLGKTNLTVLRDSFAVQTKQ